MAADSPRTRLARVASLLNDPDARYVVVGGMAQDEADIAVLRALRERHGG